jgi:hypothetical protein
MPASNRAVATDVEGTPRRSFAWARDWPGWCRAGKTEDKALEALAAYASRYRAVATVAGFPFPGKAPELAVMERVEGGATTAFGAPEKATLADGEPLGAKDVERLAALIRASWTVLDGVVASSPAVLPKGPRGGGRDRDQIVDHVLGAESAYASKIGLRLRQPDGRDGSGVTAFRDAIAGAFLGAPGSGPMGENGWLPRYAARRIAWHALDHAWEIEDRVRRLEGAASETGHRG